jgi:hypothetical protein
MLQPYAHGHPKPNLDSSTFHHHLFLPFRRTYTSSFLLLTRY